MKYKYSKEKAKSILKKYELGGSIMPDLAGHMGGQFNTGKPTLLSGFSGTHYDGLVGETGALSSGELFAQGGMIQHGLEVGDEIMGYVDDLVFVKKNNQNFVININNGKRITQDRFDKMNYKEQSKFGLGIKAIELERFLNYVNDFYGKKGIFAHQLNGGFTKMQLKKAIATYIDSLDEDTTWGGGDTIDRERVREILEM
jgi:hypothetical protein